jgi:hypothetical protein
MEDKFHFSIPVAVVAVVKHTQIPLFGLPVPGTDSLYGQSARDLKMRNELYTVLFLNA